MINITIKISKATKTQIENNKCSLHSKCKNDVVMRWSGGFYYCLRHHNEEFLSYATSDSESDSESESEWETDSDSDSDSDSDKKKNGMAVLAKKYKDMNIE